MITVDFMFEHLNPLAIKTFNGKKVVFIVPSVPLNIKNFDGVVLQENCKTYEEEQRYVSDFVITNPSDKIIVVTRSNVILTDAFACQIYTWREDLDGVKFRSVGSISTFGASPCQIAVRIFLLDKSIGNLSDSKVHEWLEKEWTQNNIQELRDICNSVGTGWPIARLQEKLNKLEDTGCVA